MNTTEKTRESLNQRCKQIGVNYDRVRSRIRKNWTEEADFESVICEDSLGIRFKSYKEMCAFWGVDYSLFCNRIKKGWDLEKALSDPTESRLFHSHLRVTEKE